jgi:hypothetical protein
MDYNTRIPVANVEVWASTLDWEDAPRTLSAADGTFSLEGVYPWDDMKAVLTAESSTCCSVRVYPRYPMRTEISFAGNYVVCALDQPELASEVMVMQCARIVGQTVDPAGNPISGVLVRARTTAGFAPPLETVGRLSEHGGYAITVPAPATITLESVAPPWMLQKGGSPFAVNPGDTITLNLTVTSGDPENPPATRVR